MNSVNFKEINGLSFRLFQSSMGDLFLRPTSSGFESMTCFTVDSPRITRDFLNHGNDDSFLFVFGSGQLHLPDSEYDSLKNFLDSFSYSEAV